MALVKNMDEAIQFLNKSNKENEEQKTKEQKFLRSENTLLIEREQVSIQSPAIARLHLRFSTHLDMPAYVKEAKRRFKLTENTSDQFPVTHKLWHEAEGHFIIEARSSKTMYTWMEQFIDYITKETERKGFEVWAKGTWSLY